MRQVGRADEEDVDAIDGGDLRGVVDGAPRLDLDDAEDPAIDRLDLRVALLPETGATRREGEPARAVGRVAHERDRLASLLGQVHPRDHDPVRTEVERAADAQSFARLRPDQGGGRCRAHRVEAGQQVGFGAGAVLEVDDQPVEAGAGHDLGRDRRPEPGERAVQRLPGSESGVEVDDTRDGRHGGLVCHGVMMPGRRSPVRAMPAVQGPLTSPVVSTTSRSRPVMTSSSCMTSSSKCGSLAPVMYQGDPLSARIIP